VPNYVIVIQETLLRKSRVTSKATVVVNAPHRAAAEEYVNKELEEDPYQAFDFEDEEEESLDNETTEEPAIVSCEETQAEAEVACDEFGDSR
jgi:hypothetical protein